MTSYYTDDEDTGYYPADDGFNDDLDRIVAQQIAEGGGEFTDNQAIRDAAQFLRNQNVNMGLSNNNNHNQQIFQNYNLDGEEYERERRRRYEETYGPQADNYNNNNNNNNQLSPLAEILLGGDGDNDYNNNQQQPFYTYTGGRGNNNNNNRDHNNVDLADIPLEDILAFDGANTQETVCSKLEKIMPYYDESLYYACKEYIFQHGLYHKHHLRTIGLSGVPLRYRLLSLWQRPLATNIGKCYFFFETLLVGLSLAQVVLETIPAYSTVVNPGWKRTWMLTEIPVSVAFFLDIVIHLIVLPSFPNDYSVYSRSSFVKSVEFWTDVGSILPTLFMFASYLWSFLGAFDFLKILRVLRFAKVLRQFSSVDQLANTVERSIKPLIAPFVFLFVAVIVNSGLIYYAESGEYDPVRKMYMQNDCDCESSAPAVLNPEYPCPKVQATILSVPHAMWWSVVTMSSVGYGDLYPRCLLGRIIGTFTILCGSVILAMPIAIVGTYFTDVVGQSKRSGASAENGEGIEKTPFHELLSGEQNQVDQNNNDGDEFSNNNSNLNDGSNNDIKKNASFRDSPTITPSLRPVNSGDGSQQSFNRYASSGSMRSGGGDQQQSQQNKVLQEQVQKLIGLRHETPGERLLHFLAECNHATVPLINPSPLIIHQINSFIKKEIEAFLRSLRVRGSYLRLQEAYYNSMTNFTLVPYRDTASSSSSSKTAALLRQKQQELKQRLEEKRRKRLALQRERRENPDAAADRDAAGGEDDDADEEYQLQVQQQELLKKAKLSEKLDQDDFAHDVRVALSQKGDKAPICLRTMPIVLCGPQLSQHMKQTNTNPASGANNSSGILQSSNPASGSSNKHSGGSDNKDGNNNDGNNNNRNDGMNNNNNSMAAIGGSMMMRQDSLSPGSFRREQSMMSDEGAHNNNQAPLNLQQHSNIRITNLISEDGRPLRHFPSGATLLPYCAPGCEIPGVPSPFAILWVCPMTNFVSITAVFPVCVTVNGRLAPFETPQRLLFGDQICVHATGSENSRPLLTYRFTRTEAPVILNNERAQLYGNAEKEKKAKEKKELEKREERERESTKQQQKDGKSGGSRKRGGSGKNNRNNNNNNNQQNDDGNDDGDSTIFDELVSEDRQKTYRVRSLAPDAVREYRSYPLSKYSTTFNSGAGEYTDL